LISNPLFEEEKHPDIFINEALQSSDAYELSDDDFESSSCKSEITVSQDTPSNYQNL
jgi:hypothetical protein